MLIMMTTMFVVMVIKLKLASEEDVLDDDGDDNDDNDDNGNDDDKDNNPTQRELHQGKALRWYGVFHCPIHIFEFGTVRSRLFRRWGRIQKL